ncbi:MAG: DUF2191 domain-containing protein [Verrucomicrobiales bacterium]|nr:DUF2191 domain-containing protein [Verrucomicrobiales bacterium]|tara:strand:+ start:839 stop:1051 length:213 start_codon:yes stop_codon:yes gene_type:complete
MRVTVDIPEETLADLAIFTGEKKKSPAVARAVDEFVKRQKVREFSKLAREGAFDYPMTNEEMEAVQDPLP